MNFTAVAYIETLDLLSGFVPRKLNISVFTKLKGSQSGVDKYIRELGHFPRKTFY